LNDAEALADAIGKAAPFAAWPRAVLLRLAAASRASSHRSGTTLIVAGRPCDQITVIAEGTVSSSVSTPDGRRLTFKIDDSSLAYGLASLADGLPLQIDLAADSPVTVIRTPIAAIRAELSRRCAAWPPAASTSWTHAARNSPVHRPSHCRSGLVGSGSVERIACGSRAWAVSLRQLTSSC